MEIVYSKEVIYMKSILHCNKWISEEEFRDNTDKYVTINPVENKEKILVHLKQREIEAVCSKPVKDPFTKKLIYFSTCEYEEGEYGWDNLYIYLFEKYNLRLDDNFIKNVLDNKQSNNGKR